LIEKNNKEQIDRQTERQREREREREREKEREIRPVLVANT